MANFLDTRLPGRFWAKCIPEPNSGCWLWLGAANVGGYGQMTIGSRTDGSRTRAAVHRLAYETLVAPIPVGLQLDHLCRTRCCVNPAHLEPVTQHVNILRGVGRAAVHAALTHCKRGHAFVNDGAVYAQSHNGRRRRTCLACRRGLYQERSAA